MDKEFVEHAIVLRVRPFRDNDLVVRFLTPCHGVIWGFAFGGRKSRRRFSGCFEELSHVIFKVKSSKNGRYFYLEEGILIDRFENIHTDKLRFGIAVNCQKFLDAVLLEQSQSVDIYNIFFYLLKALNRKSHTITKNLPIFFRAKIAQQMGYTPQMDSCNGCGRLLKEDARVLFVPDKGQMFCERCKSKNGHILLTRGAYQLFKEVFLVGDREWINIRGFPRDETVVVQGLKRFVENHLCVVWQKGRFVHV